jgi:hypothetical protein
MTPLAPTLEAYFTDRLLCQQRVSPNTIASYRDTFRLLLAFAQQHTGMSPSRLELTQLDATMIGAFLEHLETQRGNSPRTRNVRLGAIHGFFNYCALRHPEHADLIARVLAIPAKRSEKRIVTRPRAAADHGADGPARLGGDRTDQRRCASRHRPAPAGLGQRQKGARRAAHQPDRRGAQGLDARARRPAG